MSPGSCHQCKLRVSHAQAQHPERSESTWKLLPGCYHLPRSSPRSLQSGEGSHSAIIRPILTLRGLGHCSPAQDSDSASLSNAFDIRPFVARWSSSVSYTRLLSLTIVSCHDTTIRTVTLHPRLKSIGNTVERTLAVHIDDAKPAEVSRHWKGVKPMSAWPGRVPKIWKGRGGGGGRWWSRRLTKLT